MPKSKLIKLQEAMRKESIAAVIIPTADPHGSEYVADYWQLRQYFSGFTGSAGTLLVGLSDAGLWTDSRYYLQAEAELKDSYIKLFKDGEKETPSFIEWLCTNLSEKEKVLIDKSLFPINEYTNIEKELQKKDIEIISDSNFLISLREEKIPFPNAKIFLHDEKFAGQTAAEKIATIKKEIQSKAIDCLLLNSPEEIAWLFNIRACDTDYNPVPIAYAAIKTDKSILFVKQGKINGELLPYFNEQNIIIKDYDEFFLFAKNLSRKKIWIDPERMNALVYDFLPSKENLLQETSPIEKLKASLNEIQINGVRKAMQKDGVAMIRFLRWMEQRIKEKSDLDELTIAEKLQAFRAEQEDLFSESFATIAGFGAHGAIVHYHATSETNAKIITGNLLLIDSGAHYLHGTTDITRTVFIGDNPTKEQKQDYTLVLKGHIALAQTIFPEGTCGYQLDVLARKALWENNLNYGHGTGHGVGYFSCVHEGKHNIRPAGNKTPFKEGMLLSNEPGVYKTNEYGIRLENLILVKKEEKKASFLHFETVTLCPFDKKLIDFSLLTSDEIDWLNQYHQRVFAELTNFLKKDEINWLEQQILL